MNKHSATEKKTAHSLWKLLSMLPALCMMGVIFYFSAQPGVESAETSITFGARIITAVNDILRLNLDGAQITHYSEALQTLIRKTAHITEFFVLTALVMLPFYVYRVREFSRLLFSGIIVVAFAASDEIHQFFVPGRLSTVTDVCIDSIGVFLCLLFAWLIERIRRRRAAARL